MSEVLRRRAPPARSAPSWPPPHGARHPQRERARRLAAERIAMNTPIQGNRADLLKLSMLAFEEPPTAGARMVLTVHDELVFEVPEAEVDLARSASASHGIRAPAGGSASRGRRRGKLGARHTELYIFLRSLASRPRVRTPSAPCHPTRYRRVPSHLISFRRQQESILNSSVEDLRERLAPFAGATRSSWPKRSRIGPSPSPRSSARSTPVSYVSAGSNYGPDAAQGHPQSARGVRALRRDRPLHTDFHPAPSRC